MQHNCECTVNETEFFTPIPTQVVLDKAQWVDVHPTNTITTTDGPIEFSVLGSSEEFIDVNSIMLQVRVSITTADGRNLRPTDVIAPVNNIMHSLFSDVILTINNEVVEGGSHQYGYKALLTNLCTMNKGAKESQLQSSGWYKDTEGYMDAAQHNAGFGARQALFAESRQVEMCGPLLLDFFLQNKYLMHNVDFHIKLNRSKPAFQTMIKTAAGVNNRATDVKMNIHKAVLHVRRVKALPSLMAEIEDKLTFSNAVYPVQHTEIMTYSIPAGSLSNNKESIFRGNMPKLVLVGLVRNEAYNGDYAYNPYNFQNFGVNTIGLYREGESIPFRPFTPDYTSNLYEREYMSLMQALEIYNQSEDVDITRTEFKKGYNIYAFNLTPNLSVAGQAQLKHDGNLRLEIAFTAARDHSINVIVMGVFDGKLEITKQRRVITDWKS